MIIIFDGVVKVSPARVGVVELDLVVVVERRSKSLFKPTSNLKHVVTTLRQQSVVNLRQLSGCLLVIILAYGHPGQLRGGK